MEQREVLDDRKTSVASTELSCNGGLSLREETAQFRFNCPQNRGSDLAFKSQRRGARSCHKLCSDRLLIVALFIIVILWVLLVGFIALFIVRPGEVRKTIFVYCIYTVTVKN